MLIIYIIVLYTVKVKVKSLSRVRFFVTPWTAAYQAPPSLGFSRQEHWSGLPFPFPIIYKYYININMYVTHSLFHLPCFIQYCFLRHIHITIIHVVMKCISCRVLYNFIHIVPYESSIHRLLSFSYIYR